MDSAGIYLRRIGFQDIEAVLHWENELPGWNMDEHAQPYTVFDIITLIHNMEDVHACKQVRYMICHEAKQEVLGAADLTDMDFEDGSAGVGILIADPAHRNKGLATAALLLLEKEARQWNLNRLKSTVLENNPESLHLFAKLGYEKLAEQEEGYIVQGVYINAFVFEKWLSAS